MTRRIFITIEYDGTPFVGWQRQVTGLSVQQVLEEAAAELTGGDILVQGAGRTDSGVHATGQVAHLDVPDKFDANRVMEALNALTGDHPVSIIEAREVDSEAHARFSATGRRYLYRLLPRRQPPALDHGRVWHHRGGALDPGAMQAAASPASLAARNQCSDRSLRASSSAFPAYSMPRQRCANTWPCSAAPRNSRSASLRSGPSPRP